MSSPFQLNPSQNTPAPIHHVEVCDEFDPCEISLKSYTSGTLYARFRFLSARYKNLIKAGELLCHPFKECDCLFFAPGCCASDMKYYSDETLDYVDSRLDYYQSELLLKLAEKSSII